MAETKQPESPSTTTEERVKALWGQEAAKGKQFETGWGLTAAFVLWLVVSFGIGALGVGVWEIGLIWGMVVGPLLLTAGVIFDTFILPKYRKKSG